MCSFGSSGSSAPTTQFSTQTTTADPRAAQMYGQAWQAAQGAASRPFTPYSSDPNAFVAPMNATQYQATSNIAGLQGAAQPFYQMGAGMVGASGSTSSAGLMPQYMNPYMSQVIDPVKAAVQQQQALQTQNMNTDQIKAGAFGQERGGLMRAVLAGQQNLGLGQTLSPLYQDAYKTGLGAAQTDLQRQLLAGQTMGQLGSGYVGTGLAAAKDLMGAGTTQQQTEQAGKTALYNQFLMSQQYPFQTAQFLASTAAGLGPGYGGTTSGYQNSQQPLSYFGNPLSDPRLKSGPEGGEEPEVVGETKDGQKIYRYRLTNPDTGELGPVQIGLMADEVERRRPDAIGDYNGWRTVDYEKATDRSARMGGGVKPEGGDYASGGIVPQFNMPSASLSTPTLTYMQPEPKKPSGLSQLLMNAKGIYDLGESAINAYDKVGDAWNKGSPTSLPGATEPSPVGTVVEPPSYSQDEQNPFVKYASGGSTPYSMPSAEPELTHGPSEFNMPSAKLNAPELHFSGSGGGERGGMGLGEAVGIGKTIFDIGSKLLPAAMAFIPSDRRLKTGVRPARADGGSIFDNLANALSGHGYIDGSTWEAAQSAPAYSARAHYRPAGVRPHPAAVPHVRHAGVAPRGDWRSEISMLQDNVNQIDPERELGTFDRLSPEQYADELEMARSNEAPSGRLISLDDGMYRGGYSNGGVKSGDDLDYVARTMIKEAGGEGDEGMRAVADVIRNRLRSGKYGSTARDVVLAPKQFSPWNEEARGTSADPRGVDPSSGLYARARNIGGEELAGDNDITGGAMNFYNPKLAHPKWASGKEGIQIGRHMFLNASGSPGAGVKPAAMSAGDRPQPTQLASLDELQAKGNESPSTATDASTPAAGLAGMLRGRPARDFGERAADFLTSEDFVVPLLTGLGTMASSGSRYLAPSILQGLGGGAKAYAELKQNKFLREAEREKLGLQSRGVDVEELKANVALRELLRKQEEAKTFRQLIAPSLGGAPGMTAPGAPGAPGTTAPAAPTGSKSEILRQAEAAQAEADNARRMAAASGDTEEMQKFLGIAQAAEKRAADLQKEAPESIEKTEGAKQRAKDWVEQEKKIQTDMTNAQQNIDNLNATKQALNEEGVYTGPGAESFLQLRQVLDAVGYPGLKEGVANTEFFRSMANKMVTSALPGGSLGAGVSNADVAFLKQAQANIKTTKAGNNKIIDMALKLENRKQEIGNFLNEYIKQHGGIDRNFNAELAKWAKEHPMFTADDLPPPSKPLPTSLEELKKRYPQYTEDQLRHLHDVLRKGKQ